jgi:hypothetical protein
LATVANLSGPFAARRKFGKFGRLRYINGII